MTTAMERQAPDTAVLDPKLAQATDRLDLMTTQYVAALAEAATAPLRKCMVLAAGMDALERAISPEIMRWVMSVQGTAAGFRTDRDRDGKGYDERTVKRVLIQALLNGVFPANNELNIISGNLYITQNGYRRKVKNVPGLTDLDVIPGVPQVHNGQTVVRVAARWRLNGIPDQFIDGEGKPGRVFAIIVNQGSSPDQIVGKALRKALKAIYDKVTGSEHTAPDGDVDELPQGAALAGPPLGRTSYRAPAAPSGEESQAPPPGQDASEQSQELPTSGAVGHAGVEAGDANEEDLTETDARARAAELEARVAGSATPMDLAEAEADVGREQDAIGPQAAFRLRNLIAERRKDLARHEQPARRR